MKLIHISETRWGYGGDANKERYDVGYHREFESLVDREGVMRLGRLYHATSAAGWHCPVMFVSYKTSGWLHLLEDLDLIVKSVLSHWRWLVVYAWRDAMGWLRGNRS